MSHETDSVSKTGGGFTRAREVSTRPAPGETCTTCRSTRWTSVSPALPGGNPRYLCHLGHWWTSSQDAQPAAGTPQSPGIEAGASTLDLFGDEGARP